MYVEDRILFQRVLGAFDAALLAGADRDEATAEAVRCFRSLMPHEDSENIYHEVDFLIAYDRSR